MQELLTRPGLGATLLDFLKPPQVEREGVLSFAWNIIKKDESPGGFVARWTS